MKKEDQINEEINRLIKLMPRSSKTEYEILKAKAGALCWALGISRYFPPRTHASKILNNSL